MNVLFQRPAFGPFARLVARNYGFENRDLYSNDNTLSAVDGTRVCNVGVNL